jgi:hypothetical protein
MAENFLAEAWSELAIALIFICLRFYWRISHVGWRKIEWDDILMVCAGVSEPASFKTLCTETYSWFTLVRRQPPTSWVLFG